MSEYFDSDRNSEEPHWEETVFTFSFPFLKFLSVIIMCYLATSILYAIKWVLVYFTLRGGDKWKNEQTDKTNKNSPHSTGLRPLSRPLSCFSQENQENPRKPSRPGQGNRWPSDAFGQLISFSSSSFSSSPSSSSFSSFSVLPIFLLQLLAFFSFFAC